jgi:hypothetical protein
MIRLGAGDADCAADEDDDTTRVTVLGCTDPLDTTTRLDERRGSFSVMISPSTSALPTQYE